MRRAKLRSVLLMDMVKAVCFGDGCSFCLTAQHQVIVKRDDQLAVAESVVSLMNWFFSLSQRESA